MNPSVRTVLLAVYICMGPLASCSPSRKSDPPLTNPADIVWKSSAPEEFRARFETSKGEFVIHFYRQWAPIGVDRVYNLVKSGFYDDSRFYRVIKDFIVQFGIPGDPAIASLWRGVQIADDPVQTGNTRGRIAFAMTGPNTRTTQLFISLIDNSRLDEQGFAPLGEVESGLEVVDSLYSGYGESAGGGMRRGNQDRMFADGNAHLDRDFPSLDRLFRVRIIP